MQATPEARTGTKRFLDLMQTTGAYVPCPPYFELVAEPWFRSQRGHDPRPQLQPPLLHANILQQLTDFEHMAYPPEHYQFLPLL